MVVQFVKPGSRTPATASSVTVELIDPSATPRHLVVYDEHGRPLGQTTTADGTGPHGGELLTLAAPDISWFTIDYASILHGSTDDAWGVAGIEFTPTATSAPEPCGLALAAVGMAAIAAGTLRRRRAPAASAL